MSVCSALLGSIKRREVKQRKRYMSMFVSLPFLSVAFSLFSLLLFLFSAFLLYSVLRSASSLSSFLLLCPALFLSFTLLCLFSFSSSDFCLCLVSCPPLFLFCCVPFLVLSPQLCLLVVFVQDRGTALSRDLDFIGSLLCSPLLLCCVLVLCSACSELSPCSFSLLLFVLLFCSDAFCKGLCSAPCFALLFFRFGLAPLARLPLLALLPLGCGARCRWCSRLFGPVFCVLLSPFWRLSFSSVSSSFGALAFLDIRSTFCAVSIAASVGLQRRPFCLSAVGGVAV